jgi:hypothetical protein
MRPGTLFADRFEIESRAGAGGMGVVYRAFDRVSRARVALKILVATGDGGDRFSREARALAEVRHPAVVRYVAHGESTDGDRYLAMEWVDGQSLREKLRERPFTVRESVALAGRVAAALAAVHERGVVHRDVKPSNLILAGEVATVKLLDFGIARVASEGDPTRTGTRLGTVGYMAPEQARGDKDVGPRADVFALGCVLFECLTGRPPFAGVHEMAVLAKILLEEAPLASDVRPGLPRVLVDLVARMLSKAPELRPKDGAAVVAALAALGEVETIDEAPAAPRAPTLGSEERRLHSVVLAADAGFVPSIVEAHGGRLEPLAGGAVLALWSGSEAATDQAERAARGALALRAAAPAAAMALATGRGDSSGGHAVGEVIDRAARLLRPGPIRLDEVTAGLLGPRFEVGGDAAGLVLVGERDAVDVARTVLGKPTPFVGRDPEIGLLGSVLELSASESVARTIVVTGAPGVGKSRLKSEFLGRVRERPDAPEVFSARGDPLAAGAPFGLLARLLRAAFGVRDGEPLEVRRSKVRARVGRNVPHAESSRISEFLGEVAGVPFPDEKSVQLRAARRDPQLMGDQMLRAWTDWIAAETASRPVLVVLDDLQWGDPPSARFVDASLRMLSDRPLFVLGVARPEVHAALPRLWAERGVQEVRLGDLTPRSCRRLVLEVLGPDVEAGTLSRLVERSAGNPLLPRGADARGGGVEGRGRPGKRARDGAGPARTVARRHAASLARGERVRPHVLERRRRLARRALRRGRPRTRPRGPRRPRARRGRTRCALPGRA